jgi:hypothetical protein
MQMLNARQTIRTQILIHRLTFGIYHKYIWSLFRPVPNADVEIVADSKNSLHKNAINTILIRLHPHLTSNT